MSEALQTRMAEACSEHRFNRFLNKNPGLDGNPDLQWWAHRTYWRNSQAGHMAAILAVLDDLHSRHPMPFHPPLKATN